MGRQVMVTTVDNPYSPFTEQSEWLLFDTMKGYHTPERLDKVAITSDNLSDDEIHYAIEKGIEEMLALGAIDKEGNLVEYKKVVKK